MLRDLTREILELIRLTATDLPEPVERRLRQSLANADPGTAAHEALAAILENVTLARQKSVPICQDTGIPFFMIHCPETWRRSDLKTQIYQAVALATEKNYLRPNAVNPITGHNTGNNLGDDHFPSITFVDTEDDNLAIDLLLKGGGCENVGAQYSLPDEKLNAGRDLEGARKVILETVFQAQGQGCAPGFLGVAIGGDRASSASAAKEILMRRLDEENQDPALRDLEERVTREGNQLGIGPMGFGGHTTLLGTRVTSLYRLPASYFVSVSYNCWAYRKRGMVVTDTTVRYE